MKKVFLLILVLVSILLVSACAQSSPPGIALPQEDGSFRIEVSRNGFNKTPGEFRVEVEEGQEVVITFVYGDNDFPQNNPHVITILDYDITTTTIDRDNPEVTVRFTASKAGEVRFECSIDDDAATCAGHPNLQGGVIVTGEHGHEESEQHDE